MFEINSIFPASSRPTIYGSSIRCFTSRSAAGATKVQRRRKTGRGSVHRRIGQTVSHLTERLSGQADGKQKIFRDTAVENLTEFFERFRALNVGSNEQLDRLVADAQRIVRGVDPQALRDNAGLRQHVATEMSRVQSVLDGLLVDRPRRNVFRRPK